MSKKTKEFIGLTDAANLHHLCVAAALIKVIKAGMKESPTLPSGEIDPYSILSRDEIDEVTKEYFGTS